MTFSELFSNASKKHYKKSVNISSYLNKSKFYSGVDYAVIWYGNLYPDPNPQKASRNVEVFFLNLSNMTFQVEAFIPMELQLKMPIGCIIRDGYIYGKYQFPNYSVQINAKNISYANHYAVFKKEKKEYAFKPNLYPVKNSFSHYRGSKEGWLYLERDQNTMLVVKNGRTKYIIHPLIFFNNYYGLSKKINTILLNYMWGDETTSTDCVYSLLGFNRKLESSPKAVFLPAGFKVWDALFLYYLKNNEYTRNITKRLHDRVHSKFANNKPSPLKVQPFHTDDFEIRFYGMRLGSEAGVDIILCTEFTHIQLPRSKDVNYFRDETVFSLDELGSTTIVNPVRNFDSDEVTISNNDNANNKTTETLNTHVKLIGSKIKPSKIETKPDKVTGSPTVAIPKPDPSSYNVGQTTGMNGDVGLIRSYIDPDANQTDAHHHYNQLLTFAIELKKQEGSIFYNMAINCVTLNKVYGEEVKTITPSPKGKIRSSINSVYVLRLRTNEGVYYIFDTDSHIQKQGMGIRIHNEDSFKSSASSASFEKVVQELFQNDGKLFPITFTSFKSNIGVFNHVRKSSNTNWIKTIVNKLR